MVVYTIVYVLNWFSYFGNERLKKCLSYVVVLLLIFISGTRYYMGGSDVYIYENVYNATPSITRIFYNIQTTDNLGLNPNYEPGLLLMFSLIKSIGINYFGFTLILAILFYTLVFKGLKEFISEWSLFWALFMYKIMFYNTFISIRQGLTIAIFCYSLKYIRDKKMVKYFFWCLIASSVHRGALILFPLYFIHYMPISAKMIKYVALFFAPTWFIRGQVNLGRIIDKIISIIGYTDKSKGWSITGESISIIHTLECYIIVFLVLVFYDKIISTKRQKEVKLVLKLFVLTIPIFTLLSNWIIMTREKDYFVIMYGILFGYILEGNTTSLIKYDECRNTLLGRSDRVGIGNALVIATGIFGTCFIGMTRYVMMFDGGALMHFTSFITKGISIFR